MYAFGSRLSLFRLCGNDFGITPVDDIIIIIINIIILIICFTIRLMHMKNYEIFPRV